MLVSLLKPLLDNAMVAAFFCGHDHDLQVRETSVPLSLWNETYLCAVQVIADPNGADYFVTGAGHESDDSTRFNSSVPSDWALFKYPSTKV
jgi:hypothetical protein